MASIIQGFGHAAVTQPATNTTTPAAQAVALTDGEGNLLSLTAAGALPIAQATASNELVYVSVARTTANAGDSFSTGNFSSLAVDATIASFAGGTSPSITVFVDRFGADAVWYRVWTSAAVSTPGVVSGSIGPGQSGTGNAAAVLTGTARFGWTLAGAPTSVTFSASVVGRP